MVSLPAENEGVDMVDAKVLEDQLRAMAEKLTEAARLLPYEDLIIDYDNGGGQSGVRENPFYSAYSKLLGAYVKAFNAWQSAGGKKSDDISSLEDLRARFKVAK